MKLKGRHRQVQNRKMGVVDTGMRFRGCAIAILVPQHDANIAPELAQSYRQGCEHLVRKAKELSVRDMVQVQIKAGIKLQEQIDATE